MMWQLFTRVAW